MPIKKITLKEWKELGLPLHRSYIQQRKQKEGLENQFLHTIKPKQSRQSTLKNLIKALQDNGWKIREDS